MIMVTARLFVKSVIRPLLAVHSFAGHVPAALLLHGGPKGAPVIRCTSGQMIPVRLAPGVVWTQSCSFPFGHGGPGGVPQVFRVLTNSGFNGGLKSGFPGPLP